MTVQVSFQYQNNTRDLQKEQLIRAVILKTSAVLSLPKFIDVWIYKLNPGTQGGIDASMNKIILNSALTLKEIPQIVIHELIHVNQKFTGKLRINSDGVYLWENKVFTTKHPESLSHSEYQNLPWEADVINNLASIVQKALR